MNNMLLAVAFAWAPMAPTQTADALREQAEKAAKARRWSEAIKAISKVIDMEPKDPKAYLARAYYYEEADKFAEAAADLTKALELDPKNARIHQQRGLVHFKQGKIAASIADFDKYIEGVPSAKISHWQRGISYYYAGKWDDGIAQFEGYQSFDSNDVENAVWRFMCMARKDGLPKARKEILKIGDDRRVPMRQVYDLYAGTLKPEEVMTAAKAGKPDMEQLNRQLFYAHLYLGIYHELEGKKKLALEHLHKATEEHRVGHYMWDVARVHRDLLRRELEKK